VVKSDLWRRAQLKTSVRFSITSRTKAAAEEEEEKEIYCLYNTRHEMRAMEDSLLAHRKRRQTDVK
jgi:hypothetical protein